MENKNLIHRDKFMCKLEGKKELSFMKKLLIGTENEEVINRFSGEKCMLIPESVAIYDFLVGSQVTGFSTYKSYCEFYTARDIFIRNWPKEYMILLD